MNLSADAILFGLSLLERREIGAGELADHMRAVAGGDVPDHLVALEERVVEGHPRLGESGTWLGARSYYVPVDCPGCRARFRALPNEVDASALCPLCGEPIMQARSLMLLGTEPGKARRAAEAERVFHLATEYQRFAHFELMDLLGRGGAGRVYEARNLRTEARVALKLLEFQPLEPAAHSFERLQREARAASSVAHPNIVPVLDLGVAEGVPFIEMELIHGRSLRERVERQGPPPARETCRLCMEALAGLRAVHEAGIVHGDIKPANILIDESGTARLTDFGISKFLEETTTITTADRIVGSPHFMAPEQWRGERLTPATDLYAAGLVLYYAVTGRLPYGRETRLALMYKHLHEELLEPGEFPPRVPDYLGQVIRRAAEKDPEDRFESASELADALKLFLDGAFGSP
ncbi:MAG: serine/threonine-protein kinase [Candidatus Brocadiia bacterium]